VVGNSATAIRAAETANVVMERMAILLKSAPIPHK